MSSPEKRGHNNVGINRESPIVEYRIGKKTLELTRENTLIQVFDHPYADLDHVLISQDGGFKRIFGNDRLIEALDEAKFDRFLQAFPSIEDEDAYVEWQKSRLDYDLASYMNDPEDGNR